MRRRRIEALLSVLRVSLTFVLVLGLLGGFFHQHPPGEPDDACPLCHQAVQTPVQDLADSFSAPVFAPAEYVTPAGQELCLRIVSISKLIPRAPPL